jgi:hypothetical protein
MLRIFDSEGLSFAFIAPILATHNKHHRMQDIQEVYNRIQEKKKERKRLKRMLKDGLDASAPFREIKDEMEKVKAKKKEVENGVFASYEHEKRDIEGLDEELKSEQQVMDDIALTMYMKGESIVFKNENDEEYEPTFKVKYKKAHS